MELYPISFLVGTPHIDQMELADFGGVSGLPDDPAAEMAAAFGYGEPADELTEREIDAMFVEEMERRDAEAREVFGGGDDDGPKPPAGAALVPDDESADYWQAVAARMGDDILVRAIGAADDDPYTMALEKPAVRAAFLDGFTRELLRRLDARQRAAA